MSHSLNCVWIHAVFGTAERTPWITDRFHNRLHGFLRATMRDLHCPVSASNGMADHVHLLFLMDTQQALSSVMSKVKANSSRWIKSVDPALQTFAWQAGYAAFAVSPSMKQRVMSYIDHQEEHHRSRSFDEEYRELIRLGEISIEFSGAVRREARHRAGVS